MHHCTIFDKRKSYYIYNAFMHKIDINIPRRPPISIGFYNNEETAVSIKRDESYKLTCTQQKRNRTLWKTLPKIKSITQLKSPTR